MSVEWLQHGVVGHIARRPHNPTFKQSSVPQLDENSDSSSDVNATGTAAGSRKWMAAPVLLHIHHSAGLKTSVQKNDKM